jgi:hypothetical protein
MNFNRKKNKIVRSINNTYIYAKGLKLLIKGITITEPGQSPSFFIYSLPFIFNGVDEHFVFLFIFMLSVRPTVKR